MTVYEKLISIKNQKGEKIIALLDPDKKNETVVDSESEETKTDESSEGKEKKEKSESSESSENDKKKKESSNDEL